MATYSFHCLYGESRNWPPRLGGDIRILFLHKCLLSSPPHFIQPLSKSLNFFGCYSNVKGTFLKKKIKNEAETLHTNLEWLVNRWC